MTDLNRFSLIGAEESGGDDSCPHCGCLMVEASMARTINFWYCEKCDLLRPRKNKYGHRAPKKDFKV